MQRHLKVKQIDNGKGPFSGCRDDWQLPGASGPKTKSRANDMRRPPFDGGKKRPQSTGD